MAWLSNEWVTHPPRSNPPLRSSSGPPSPCITPSTETIVMVVSFMIGVPFSLSSSSFDRDGSVHGSGQCCSPRSALGPAQVQDGWFGLGERGREVEALVAVEGHLVRFCGPAAVDAEPFDGVGAGGQGHGEGVGGGGGLEDEVLLAGVGQSVTGGAELAAWLHVEQVYAVGEAAGVAHGVAGGLEGRRGTWAQRLRGRGGLTPPMMPKSIRIGWGPRGNDSHPQRGAPGRGGGGG